MDSGTQTLDAAVVLAAARSARRDANAAETRVLVQAVEWCRLHEVTDLDDAATWMAGHGQDTGIPIAGDGAPLVSEFAVAEFASALGLSAGSGRVLVGHALELAHRLPRTWARVLAGDLAPWRARRIAEETQIHTADAAAWLDVQVAPFAHRTGPAQVQRTVETAIATFMPEFAAERRDRAAEQRYFAIEADQDVRRAAAVGALARGELHLDLQRPGHTLRTSWSAGGALRASLRGRHQEPRRQRHRVAGTGWRAAGHDRAGRRVVQPCRHREDHREAGH
jgi:hypothetical protein